MKAIQVSFDEDLLRELDEDPEVREAGRSAVLRRAAAEYLERRREERIDEEYRRAYANGDDLGPEWEGWAKEGSWPDEA